MGHIYWSLAMICPTVIQIRWVDSIFASIATFEVCLTSGWSFIDIKGADGEQKFWVNKGLQVLMVGMEPTGPMVKTELTGRMDRTGACRQTPC